LRRLHVGRWARVERESSRWASFPRRERADLTAYRLESAALFLGPGGFGTPDDIEALESCQIGFGAPEVEWSDLSRGMRRVPRSDDELAARGFWRQWHALIQGHDGAERMGDVPVAQAAVHAREARR